MKLKEFPRPNKEELPELYMELDRQIKRVENVIRRLPEQHFDKDEEIIHFGRMQKSELCKIIAKDPDTMVICFTRVCGLSDREFFRLYGLENVYKLRKAWQRDLEATDRFLEALIKLLPKQMYLETFLYTFYRMWEEHQKRHYRAKFEPFVRNFFQRHGYECRKIVHPTEVNGAIPPTNPQVVMQVRTGVRKDLVKRAKEFSVEFDRSLEAYPNSKFIVIFKIPDHQLKRRNEIRQVIIDHRKGKKQYDAVLFQDELEEALKKLRKWKVQKATSVEFA